MPVSVEYVARETAANLWRNRLMTFAAVLTVAVSLSLVGAALLLRQGAANASSSWERGSTLQVFMKPDANAQEISAVKTQLGQLNTIVQPCVFHDKAWNYQEARKIDGPVVDGNVSVSAMPTSFWCTPITLPDAGPVVKTFGTEPGVYSAVAPLSTLRTEQTVINWIKWGCVAIAIVLIISAAVLILNSIRMAIFARRREVSVMKLVGATNWFIRVPFMSEGMLQGLVGSLVASLVLYLSVSLVNHFANGASAGNLGQQLHFTTGDAIVTDIVIVVVGSLLGGIGSAIAIRRFLDV
ncbi:MAG TPA: FtsX-like permease family protein [Acidimicrobiales bacterium]